MVVGGGAAGWAPVIVEVHRAPGGKEISQVVEFWEFEPSRRLSIRVVDGPMPIDGTLIFETARRRHADELQRLRKSGRPVAVRQAA